jgi:hypothetical protein
MRVYDLSNFTTKNKNKNKKKIAKIMIVYPKFYTLSSAPQNGISSVKISTKI